MLAFRLVNAFHMSLSRVFTRILVAAAVISALAGLIRWAKQTEDVKRIVLEVKARTASKAFKWVILAPKGETTLPLIIYLCGEKMSFTIQGSIARRLAQAGFTCAYVKNVESHIELNEQSFGAFFSALNELPACHDKDIILLADNGDASLLIKTLATRVHCSPRMLVCVPGPNWQHADSINLIQIETKRALPIILIKTSNIGDNHSELEFVTKQLTHLRQPVFLFCYVDAGDTPTAKQLLIREAVDKACYYAYSTMGKPLPQHLKRRETTLGLPCFYPLICCAILLTCSVLWTNIASYRKTGVLHAQTYLVLVACGLTTGLWVGVLTITRWRPFTPHIKNPNVLSDISTTQWRRPLAEENGALLDQYYDLATYNRSLVKWNVSDTTYNNYVLNPDLGSGKPMLLMCRDVFWKRFYPTVKNETSTIAAAAIVVRELREELTVDSTSTAVYKDPLSSWNDRITSENGFELSYVAALRSVGIPSRLTHEGLTELYNNDKWIRAPRPPTLQEVKP